MMLENIEKYHQKYGQPCDVGFPLGAICLIVSRGGAFFLATCFSEPSRGTPKGDCGPPLGVILDPPWSDFTPPPPPQELFARQSSETVGQIVKCHSHIS